MPENIENSLTDFSNNVIQGFLTQQNTIAQPDNLMLNLRNYMISNNRNLLSSLYVENGLIQTLIDQPIEDAYRDDIEIVTSQLDSDDKTKLIKYYNETCKDEFVQTLKWGRLFGGAGLIINVPQDPEKELNLNLINDRTKIEFYAADRWELNYQPSGEIGGGEFTQGKPISSVPYNFYGQPLHASRVLQIKGKKAPSILSLQLMGWGMSEVERLIRSLNSYIKNQDVVYELLDEAKIDVYKIRNYNSSLNNPQGTNAISKRVQLSNTIKNYLNALTMDVDDDYQQKQMAFSGLGDILTQIRQGVACDMKMPITKLFGVSSAGFNSGEDDIENYNSMVQSDIRGKNKGALITLLEICCMKLFGNIPDDLDVSFKPLKILSALDEENVKTSQFNRVIQAKDAGLIDDAQAQEAIDTKNLLPITLGQNG